MCAIWSRYSAPATGWCETCAIDLAVRTDQPHLVSPRLDPGVPVFSLGRYAGARRRAVVAVKEHGRSDLVAPLAGALRNWGMTLFEHSGPLKSRIAKLAMGTV